jgi:hypothetical protein
MSKRIGDVSRRRRLADPVRVRWYARHRASRWARRFFGDSCPPPGGADRLATKGMPPVDDTRSYPLHCHAGAEV